MADVFMPAAMTETFMLIKPVVVKYPWLLNTRAHKIPVLIYVVIKYLWS
jgi:hypothetical protein